MYNTLDSNNEGEGGFGDLEVSELDINYQELFVLKDGTTVSWFVNETCSERFEVQGYTLMDEPELSQDHVYEVENASSFTIPSDQYTNSEGVNIDYRLVSLVGNGEECPDTRSIYYRFNGMACQALVCSESYNESWSHIK